MDNESNYSTTLPNGNSNMIFDRFWEQYGGRLPFSSNEAQPTQPAPFFQFSPYSDQKSFTTGPSPKLPLPPSHGHSPQTMNESHQADAFSLAQGHRARITLASRTQPSTKRQKIAHPTNPVYDRQKTQEITGKINAASVAGPESECCSSCSDGIPCASPDCAPCSEPGCNSKTIEVIPCNRKACEQPACTDQCLATGIQIQQALFDQNATPSERVMSNLVEPPWNHQIPRNGSQICKVPPGGTIDPALKDFGGLEKASASASPSPTAASMGNNVPTPFSPNNGLPTPQLGLFPCENLYATHSRGDLSGTGAMFNSLSHQWPEQIYSQSNDLNNASMFQCTWDGCYQPFTSYENWLPHLHRDHVDPQMIFGCPIQAENCPETINVNPLDHLQIDHGFNFDINDNNFSCPAPDCLPTETFCDPATLHNHFDHAHATPAQGGLRCRLEKECDFFGDYSQLFSHINEHHQLPLMPGDEKIKLSQSAAPAAASLHVRPTEADSPDGENRTLNTEEAVHGCKWEASDKVCGFVCQSEIDLQTHIKHSHLDSLDKHSGYKCMWEGCKRKEMPDQKEGFSQRGKLERHMATHTNFKCSICDVCGQKFSAPQSMKQHRLLHTGEKPWKCKHCGKAFPQQSACTIHERTHTNEKPLECSVCGKKFSESSNLSKHRKIHGERGLHACNFEGCGKSFHRLDQLKRHAITHERKLQKAASSESDSAGTKTEIDRHSEEDLLSDP